MAKKSPIRTAVLGLGRAGWLLHVAAIRNHKEQFLLTDVADVNSQRLAEARAEFNCHTYTDWRELLKRSDAELVVVATMSHQHAPMSIAALQAGKHVLVEKPMARNAREADRMLAAAQKAGRILTVHQSRHSAPDILHIHEVIKSGKLGKIYMIKRRMNYFSRRNDWQTLKKYGGGQLNNTGVHPMEQLMQLLDSPVKKVFGDLQQVVNPGDVEDHVKIVMKAESGLVIDFETSMAYAAPCWSWVLLGSHGALWSDGKTSYLKYVRPNALRKLNVIDSTEAPRRAYGVNGVGEEIPWITEEMPTASQKTVDFYDCLYKSIRLGKPLLVDPVRVRDMHAIIDRARKGTGF